VIVDRKKVVPDPKNPGPSEYRTLNPLGQDAVGFKLKNKLEFGSDEFTAVKRAIPGAGTYEDILKLDKEGRYTSSQYVNSKSARWGREKRLSPPRHTNL